MTEKRYIVDDDEAIIDTKTNREYTTWDISGVEDICNLLNFFYEENERLKKENKDLESFRYNVFRSMDKARVWREKKLKAKKNS